MKKKELDRLTLFINLLEFATWVIQKMKSQKKVEKWGEGSVPRAQGLGNPLSGGELEPRGGW